MSTDSQQTAPQLPVLEFKSSTFSVPVLALTGNELMAIEQQLLEKIHLAPEFFKNSPLIFDLQELNKHELDLDVGELIQLIRRLDLLPIGIRGGAAHQNLQALELGIPVHSVHSTTIAAEKKPSISESESSVITPSSTLITQPVRSGQRIYAKGDLIILAQVSPGAEILAEGNIHVYASLRGRALAGVQGDAGARIFCSDLQAELISIAGSYKVSEDLNSAAYTKPVQIYLQNNTLIIKDI